MDLSPRMFKSNIFFKFETIKADNKAAKKKKKSSVKLLRR